MTDIDKLADMIHQSLDQQGHLSKVKALIKTSLYQAVNNPNAAKVSIQSQQYKDFQASPLSGVILQLFVEFLQFIGLEHTLTVFKSESNINQYWKRNELLDKISLAKKDNPKIPVVQILVQEYNSGNKGVVAIGSNASSNPNQNIKAEPVKPVELSKTKPQTPSTPSTNFSTSVAAPATKTSAQPAPNVQTTKQPVQQTISTQPQKQTANNYKSKSGFDFEEIEEDLPEEPMPKKGGTLYTSSEDIMQSQSHQYDMTVDSVDLDDYDYVEPVKGKK